MAIIGITEKTALRLELDGGMVDGKQRVQSKSFNRVKAAAEDEDLHGVAVVLSELQKKELLRVKKVEETVLVSE